MPGGDGYVLLAVAEITDGVGEDQSAGLKAPKGLAGAGVQSENVA